MSEALSTYPGFARSVPSPTSAWLDPRYGSSVVPIKLGSGAVVPVPMLFWNACALVLHGVADPDAVDGLLLGRYGLRARLVNPDNLLEPKSAGGKAWVQIWGPDYQGTTMGPIKAVFASVAVEPRRRCPVEHQGLIHSWWWWYYGNSVVNHEFKRDVWGVPSQLGVLETAYHTDAKGVRLLEDGQVALRLGCDLAGLRRWLIVNGEGAETPGTGEAGHEQRLRRYCEKLAGSRGKPASFVTVARRCHDDGENEVDLVGAKLIGDRPDGTIPFRGKGNDFYAARDTTVRYKLEAVGFEPVAWDFYTDYSGVVKIYDERGRATP
jgi:hypothetical protein